MTRILLIQPPIRDFYLTAKRTVPYGLSAVAAALRRDGHDVALLDALATGRNKPLALPAAMAHLEPHYGRSDRSPFALFHQYRHFGLGFERIGRAARDSGADVVGISSLFTAYSQEALKTAEAVRAWHPAATVVMGGHHPTALPEAVMASSAVDFVLRGEGEAAMPALLAALSGHRPLSTVPGIVFRREDGALHTEPPAVMTDPDRFPQPAADLVDGHHYRRKSGASAVVVTSRGCPMACTYCCLGAGSSLPYRRRSLDRVLAEIRGAVIQNHARFIDFEDENLTLDRPWFLAMLAAVRKEYRPLGLELRAMNGLFPPSLDPEMVDAMAAAGFRTLNLSLGSTHARRLKAFGRPDVRAAFDRAVAWARERGLGAVGYLIVAAPHQPADESLADLIRLATQPVLIGMSVFYPAPGSRDYDTCRELGLLPSCTGLMRASALPLAHKATRKETATLLRLARIVNFIKLLKDNGEVLPTPEPWDGNGCLDPGDRLETGKRLLAWFGHDGIIRGVDKDGGIYQHQTDRRLVQAFLAAVPPEAVQGAGTAATG